MRDASVPAPDAETGDAVGAIAPSAADLFKSGAVGINAEVRHDVMLNQNAFVAETTNQGDVGGTVCTTKEESIDIGGDFFGRQMSAKGMASFDMKHYAADTIDRYHGGIKATLTNKSMSLDSSLKRSDALSAPKIKLG